MKHAKHFRQSKLLPGERLLGSLEGWIGNVMGKGSDTQHHGALLLTNRRLAFYRKGLFGEVFEAIPVNKITSVETRSLFGYRAAAFHTSHDALRFKCFTPKAEFGQFLDRVEQMRANDELPSPPRPAAMTSELQQLLHLRRDGTLTQEEYGLAKSTLLKRGSILDHVPSPSERLLGARDEVSLHSAKAEEKDGFWRAMITIFVVCGAIFYWAAGSDDGEAEASAVATKPAVTAETKSNASTLNNVASVERSKTWSDDRICGHGLQTYFFVVMPPRIIDWQGSSWKFRTEAGNEMWCTLRGNQIEFQWTNGSGEPMVSQSTTYAILPNGKLHVKSDMQDISFDF